MLSRAQGLVIRSATRVDAALLDRAPALQVVGRAGVGLDNVDIGACEARGVRVVHTPEANAQAVAEFVGACMLDALRPRVFVETPMDAESWEALRDELVAPRQVGDLTLGVLGLGRVGSRVARLGAGLGMRVVYHDVREIEPSSRFGAEPVGREALFRESDVLSVHVDGRASNRGVVGETEIAMLRPGVVFINTSRAFVVDTAALGAFLRAHPGACAMVDVHANEPFGEDDPLFGLPNAHLSPHIGAATESAKLAMGWVVRDVWAVLCGEPPRYPAAPESR